tara:strand:+ start:905 stop:1837 length:933 start_codon:yes stop_codon:yes gene_type:complete
MFSQSFQWSDGCDVSWWLFVMFLAVLYLWVGLGVVLVYHRVLTHKAAQLKKPLLYLLVLGGLPAGVPIQWVGHHRFHHGVSDQPQDGHSPVQHGFWRALTGWYLERPSTALAIVYAFAGPGRLLFDAWWRPRSSKIHDHLAADIAADPFLRWVSQPLPYAGGLLLLFGMTFGLAVVGWGLTGAAAMYVFYVFMYWGGDLINAAGHGEGARHFRTKDHSRNPGWLAVITLGDGLHNSHHAFPNSIRNDYCRHQWDGAYGACRLFEKMGWAHHLRVPAPEKVQQKVLDGISLKSPFAISEGSMVSKISLEIV